MTKSKKWRKIIKGSPFGFWLQDQKKTGHPHSHFHTNRPLGQKEILVRNILVILAATAALALAACGGGGGGSAPSASTPSTASATTDTTSNSTAQVPVAKYKEVVYGIWTGGYLYRLGKTPGDYTPVVNGTSFAGTRPFINCGTLKDNTVLDDGTRQIKCTSITTNQMVDVRLDPSTNKFLDFKGTTRPETDFNFGESVTITVNGVVIAGTTGVQLSDGSWVYAGLGSSNETRTAAIYQPTTGNAITVRAGTRAADEDIRLIRAFSN